MGATCSHQTAHLRCQVFARLLCTAHHVCRQDAAGFIGGGQRHNIAQAAAHDGHIAGAYFAGCQKSVDLFCDGGRARYFLADARIAQRPALPAGALGANAQPVVGGNSLHPHIAAVVHREACAASTLAHVAQPITKHNKRRACTTRRCTRHQRRHHGARAASGQHSGRYRQYRGCGQRPSKAAAHQARQASNYQIHAILQKSARTLVVNIAHTTQYLNWASNHGCLRLLKLVLAVPSVKLPRVPGGHAHRPRRDRQAGFRPRSA